MNNEEFEEIFNIAFDKNSFKSFDKTPIACASIGQVHIAVLNDDSIFLFLLTIYLVIKRKESFLGIKPLKPKKLKDTIITLGASFIKLAQVLATRADFFSADYLDELKELHDKLPPMNNEEFEEIFNIAFDKNSFKSFDKTPISKKSAQYIHSYRCSNFTPAYRY